MFVSGIGCSSRFPYYMNTYGMHTIHGRAPAVATGIKAAQPRPDGLGRSPATATALSIGGNHFMHVLRRNVDIKLLLFNNRIYGLTKGQYSPDLAARQEGQVARRWARSTIRSIRSAWRSARARPSSRARSTCTCSTSRRCSSAPPTHKGTAFVEIYQNCNIFNDGAFAQLHRQGQPRPTRVLELEHGKPLRFGKNNEKGIVLDARAGPAGRRRRTSVGEDKLLVHDETSEIARPADQPPAAAELPDADRRVSRGGAPELR